MSAGFWVKMRRSLSSDPDVFRIGELTKLDRFSVVGRLHAVWSWADEHDVAKRDAVSVTTAYVDSVADCVGFAEAMRQVGWLAGSDGALRFPNFERHNGRDAKRKAQTALRNQQMRSRSEVSPLADDDKQGDAVSVTNASPEKSEEKTKEKSRKKTVAAGAAGVSTKSRKRSVKGQEPVPIPGELDTEAGRKALDELREHRRQMKKPLTSLAETKLLAEWSSKGADRFVEAVDRSIANGWQGIFERDDAKGRNGKTSPGLMDSLHRFVAAEGES